MTGPVNNGRWHYVEAERLLAMLTEAIRLIKDLPGVDDITKAELADAVAPLNLVTAVRALGHAALAQAAPIYAFHQEPRTPVADSPNIAHLGEH